MAFYINVKPDDYENVIKVMVNNSDKISELKKSIKSKMKLSAQDTLQLFQGKTELLDTNKLQYYGIRAGDQLRCKVQTFDHPRNEGSSQEELPSSNELIIRGRSFSVASLSPRKPRQKLARSQTMPKLLPPPTHHRQQQTLLLQQRQQQQNPARQPQLQQQPKLPRHPQQQQKLSHQPIQPQEQLSQHQQQQQQLSQQPQKQPILQRKPQDQQPQEQQQKLSQQQQQQQHQNLVQPQRHEQQNSEKAEYKSQEARNEIKRPNTVGVTNTYIYERPFSTQRLRRYSDSDLNSIEIDLTFNKAATCTSVAEITSAHKQMRETGTMTTPSLADHQPEKNIKEALCPFIGEMVDAILDPESLANKLYSNGLIPRPLLVDIISTSGLRNTLKSMHILKQVQTMLTTSRNPIEVLKTFCRALSADPALKPFIPRIEDKIGGTPLVRITSARTTGTIAECRQCCVTEDDISTIVTRVINAAEDWYLLGAALGVQPTCLNIIGNKHLRPGNRFAQVITVWITTNSSPTWQKLTNCLMRLALLKLTDLGMELKREFCKDCCCIII